MRYIRHLTWASFLIFIQQIVPHPFLLDIQVLSHILSSTDNTWSAAYAGSPSAMFSIITNIIDVLMLNLNLNYDENVWCNFDGISVDFSA